MIEADSRRTGHARPASADVEPASARSRRRYGYHFTSLVAIAVLHGCGHVGVPRGLLGHGARRGVELPPPRERADAAAARSAPSRAAARGVLGVCATTATAGIIVGVVTLTGLGLKISGLIVALAGGHLFLTVLYSALAVWMLGLAVPVTASYIIAAVMVAPALVQAGVPDVAAHMFIFYYAVLSEVSPPTALSPFAAAAITGGNPVRDDDADVEVHAAGVPGPVRLHADAPRARGPHAGARPATSSWSRLTAAAGIAALAAGVRRLDPRPRVRPRARASPASPEALLFYADRLGRPRRICHC